MLITITTTTTTTPPTLVDENGEPLLFEGGEPPAPLVEIEVTAVCKQWVGKRRQIVETPFSQEQLIRMRDAAA
jgi:phage terminase large subunit